MREMTYTQVRLSSRYPEGIHQERNMTQEGHVSIGKEEYKHP